MTETPPAETTQSSSPSPPRSRLRDGFQRLGLRLVLINAGVLALYFLAGKFGLALAFVNISASAIWPPTGIALALVLLLGYEVLPAILVGAFAVNQTTTGDLPTSVAIAFGNTLEAFAGAWLVRRYANGGRSFDRARDVFRFAVLAALVATTISASMGVTSLAIGGLAPWSNYGPVWTTWWLGDAVGALIVAPFILLWSQEARIPVWTGRRWGELVLLMAALLLAGFVAFGPLSPAPVRHFPLEFIALPFIAWSGLRFGPREAATAAIALDAAALWGTLHGYGPFAIYPPETSLLLLQAFMGIVSAMGLGLAAVVQERRAVERDLRDIGKLLDRRVQERTADLREAMGNLESFAYTVSHDLRAPLRAINAHGHEILEDHADALKPRGRELVEQIRTGTLQMAHLIDALLELSRVARCEINPEPVDLAQLAVPLIEQLRRRDPDRKIDFSVAEDLRVYGDPQLLRSLLQNLLENAWKFTRGRDPARIVLDSQFQGPERVLFVRDNGAGFDLAHAGKLFVPFQRLHSPREFEGTGIGLATAQRIVQRHKGRIWAEAEVRKGATFYFTLDLQVGAPSPLLEPGSALFSAPS